MTRGSYMYQRRKRARALAVALVLVWCASGALAAAPPHALPDSYLDNAPVPLPGRLNIGVPSASAAFAGDDTWLAISQARANVATSCTSAAFAAASPSAASKLCFDTGSVPSRDLSDISPLVSVGAIEAGSTAPDADSRWSAISPIGTNAVALSIPAASTEASSRGIPDLRPDNPPIPPPDWRNIWVPVSASTPGGNGTWSTISPTWTSINGGALAPMSPQPGFAHFQGTPGTVTVDDSTGDVSVTGMEFAVDGYVLTGDALTLVPGLNDVATIYVDDDASSGTAYKAVINNTLVGNANVTLMGPGTLVLTGNNTYSGWTSIAFGTLQLGNGGTSGSIAGNIMDSTSLVFDRSDAITYGGVISRSGSVTQAGTGTLTLTGTNTYSGGTNIKAGVLQISSDANLGATTGKVLIDNGTLRAAGSFTSWREIDIQGTAYIDTAGNALTLSGDINGSDPGQDTLVKQGTGTLTITNPFGSGYEFTKIDAGTLALSGGATGLPGPNLTIAGGATFDVSALGGGASYSISALSGNGTVVLGDDCLNIESGNTSWTFGGVIEDGVSGTVKSVGLGISEPGVIGTLTGVNTYTNETFVDQGTLALVGNGSIADSRLVNVDGTLDVSDHGATIKDLAGSGSVVLGNQTLTVTAAGGTGTFRGAISGSGRLVLSGGDLTLEGANTYTGGTTIAAGATLQLGWDNPGSVVGDVADNGSLIFASPADTTYAGVISGTGSVTHSGGRTLTLTGANTFTGGIIVDVSTLSVGEDANLGAADGALTLETDGTLETTASFSTGRNVVLQGVATIQTDSGSDLTTTGVISGSGPLIKTGPGILTLSGIGTWTGGTEIMGGSLRSAHVVPGDVSVDTSGILDSVPGVAGSLTNITKVAVKGGDTTVGDNYKQENTGTLAVSLGSKLAVTGTATLNGGTLEVTGADPGYVANTHTDVLTATGGVIGTFDQLVKDSGVVFTSTTIGYGPNDVYLDTTGLNITVAAKAMGIIEPAAMSAAQRVQDGFEAINATMASGGEPSSDVLQGAGAIQHSATPAVAQATLTSLSGQLHAASAAMLFDGIDARSDALSEHFDDLVSRKTKSGVWYGDLGWQGNLQRGGYAGATFRSDGGMAGADMRIGQHALLGFAAGQSNGFGQLDAAWDHNRTWMNSLAMYGGLVNGPWYANAQIAGGWYREDMQRLLQLGAMGALVGAGSNGGYVGGSFEGGRVFNFGTTRVVPFVDVRYQRLDLGGFTEQGGLGYGLTADARTAGRFQAGLGVRAERGWRLANGMRMEFDGSAGWQHSLHQYGSVFGASFTGFNDWMPVEGTGLSEDTVVLRTGLSLWPNRNFGLRLGYMREQDQRERAGSAMLQGAVTF